MRRGHEVGHHGYMHEPPASLEPQEEAEVLDRGIGILEGITGKRPQGYRSPSWDLTRHSLGFLAERNFVYDSSLMGHDAPQIPHLDKRKTSLAPATKRAKMFLDQEKRSPTRCSYYEARAYWHSSTSRRRARRV